MSLGNIKKGDKMKKTGWMFFLMFVSVGMYGSYVAAHYIKLLFFEADLLNITLLIATLWILYVLGAILVKVIEKFFEE